MSEISNREGAAPLLERPARPSQLKPRLVAADTPLVMQQRGRGLIYLLAILAAYVLFVGLAWVGATAIAGHRAPALAYDVGAFVLVAAVLSLLVFAALLVRWRSEEEPLGEDALPHYIGDSGEAVESDRLTA